MKHLGDWDSGISIVFQLGGAENLTFHKRNRNFELRIISQDPGPHEYIEIGGQITRNSADSRNPESHSSKNSKTPVFRKI